MEMSIRPASWNAFPSAAFPMNTSPVTVRTFVVWSQTLRAWPLSASDLPATLFTFVSSKEMWSTVRWDGLHAAPAVSSGDDDPSASRRRCEDPATDEDEPERGGRADPGVEPVEGRVRLRIHDPGRRHATTREQAIRAVVRPQDGITSARDRRGDPPIGAVVRPDVAIRALERHGAGAVNLPVVGRTVPSLAVATPAVPSATAAAIVPTARILFVEPSSRLLSSCGHEL